MTKDEIKNRISMALKSPVLQQGFEIICKQNIELGKHNEELIALINAERGGQDIMKKFLKNVYIIIRYFGFGLV